MLAGDLCPPCHCHTQFDLLNRLTPEHRFDYENRIIILTDAMSNIGETREKELLDFLKYNANKEFFISFIGIGVDFNSKLVDRITKIRGQIIIRCIRLKNLQGE